MTTESIHDLFRRVREHPDFVFGTIFVRDDLYDDDDEQVNEDALIAELSPKHVEDRLAEIGNEQIAQARRVESGGEDG